MGRTIGMEAEALAATAAADEGNAPLVGAIQRQVLDGGPCGVPVTTVFDRLARRYHRMTIARQLATLQRQEIIRVCFCRDRETHVLLFGGAA